MHPIYPLGTLDTQHSGKRAKVFVHQGNQKVIVAHRGTKGLADILTDATAVIGGRRKHNKRFQHAQAVTDRVRAAHPHADITVVGHSLGGTQDTKGTNKQITFNKGTSLRDVLYRRTKPTQTDYCKTGMSFLCCPTSSVEKLSQTLREMERTVSCAQFVEIWL
jgi:hypothetical protein